MIKYFLTFLFLISMCNISYASVSVSSFLTADDVTVTHLEEQRVAFQGAINSADGGLIQSGTITSAKLDANTNPENRWNEAFNDFVYTGLLPPTSASLTAITTAGTAYINGARVLKDATSKLYTASKWTYVDLSSTGTYTYSETAITGSEPAVASNSIRLARVSTDSSTVLSIIDRRITSISTASVYVGSFTRDISTASGDQTITGVGFTPKAVMFLSGVQSDTATVSWGIGDGTSAGDLTDRSDASGGYEINSGESINMTQGAGAQAKAYISSFNTDGFVLTWIKAGSPTGTATVRYLAFR